MAAPCHPKHVGGGLQWRHAVRRGVDDARADQDCGTRSLAIHQSDGDLIVGVLSHIRVLELGQVLDSTCGGVLLADLGAEVIKIEPPRGDAGRNPEFAIMNGESAVHLTMNRGKKSTVINLKHAQGLRAFHDLVRHSDVIIDNFRPGVPQKLKADYPGTRVCSPGCAAWVTFRFVGIEGTGSYGAGLARHLIDRGVEVLEVPRPDRRRLRRQLGKSDPVDFEAAARAVLSGHRITAAKVADGPMESIRMLRLPVRGP